MSNLIGPCRHCGFDALESQARQITALVAALREAHEFLWADGHRGALGEDDDAPMAMCRVCEWNWDPNEGQLVTYLTEAEAATGHAAHQDAVIASVMDGAR